MIQFYQISLSLPFKPLKLHSYIFRNTETPDQLLLLDSGVNQPKTIAELENGLKTIDSNLNIDSIKYILPSHAHIDHIGGLELIKEHSGAKILMHKEEYNYFENERPSFWIDSVFEDYGIPKKDIEQFHTYLDYYQDFNKEFSPDILFEGNSGKIPFFNDIEFIKISGHTPHHIALILEEEKTIFTGDTLLSRITPNLGFSGLNANPVKEYLTTLTRLANDFNNWISYPAHQEIVTNIKERAEILKFLLEERLQYVKKYFKEEKKGLPSLIKFLYPSVWTDLIQRFLAIMETTSYIKYFFGKESPFKEPYEEWN